MVCKYCGETLKSGFTGNRVPILIGRTGPKCSQTKNGRHVASSGTMMVCKYCGANLKAATTGNCVPVLKDQQGIFRCSSSPHGKHELCE